jgi:hypothetical protein
VLRSTPGKEPYGCWRGLREGSGEVVRVIGSCRVARWLEANETHHPGFEGQYELFISFQPTLLDHFANSGFVSLEGQTKILGFAKSQVEKSRKRDPNHWIQATGESLDQNLYMVSCIGGLGVERVYFRLQKS